MSPTQTRAVLVRGDDRRVYNNTGRAIGLAMLAGCTSLPSSNLHSMVPADAGDDAEVVIDGGTDATDDLPPICAAGTMRSCAEAGLIGPCGEGVQFCTSAGLWSECTRPPLSRDSCAVEGDDSNCNGMPNEGCTCLVGAERSCGEGGLKGACAAGKQYCTEDGVWELGCSIAPAADDRDGCADGSDADCDGTPNEGCTCIEGETQSCDKGGLFGRCAAGKMVCGTDGTWGPCSIAPRESDTCADGNDENCNGVQNEDCPCVEGETRACPEGGFHGPCAGGVQHCQDTQWGTSCSISPEKADRCTPNDDANCDGIVNGNPACACLQGETHDSCGECKDGTSTCTEAGTWGTCTGGSKLVTYFRDADGDARGDPNSAVRLCGAAPRGYVSSGDDVNDCAAPSSAFHTTAMPKCGSTAASFDWNHDRVETRQRTQLGSASGCFACGCTVKAGWQGRVPPCGQAGEWIYDCQEIAGNVMTRTTTQIQACR